jgi:hypothetical protein
MSEGMTEVWGEECMDAVEAREATEGNLIARGRWPGELQIREDGHPAIRKVGVTEDGNEPHPMDGKPVYGCHAILRTDDGDKHLFFDACGLKITATSKSGGTYTRQESQNGGFLYTATKMFGRPFAEVLQYAAEHTLVYDIGVKKASDEYPAKNTIRGIYAVEKE